MATSMAAAIAAAQPKPQAAPTPTAAPVQTETIPASMAKLVDIEAEIPITGVQLDGLVVMKIINHCREVSSSQTATGLLLGLDLDGTLEVSNSFPVPSSGSDDGEAALIGSRYQTSMLRALKEVQGDNNVVGFYQSSTMGAFLRSSLVEIQASHQATLRHGGIVVVHNISQAASGNAGLRAFRLKSSFMAAHKGGKFSASSLVDHRLTFSTILDELPVQIRNSPLLSAFLKTLTQPTQPISSILSPLTFNTTSPTPIRPSFDNLSLPPSTTLSRNMELVSDAMDACKTEEGNLAYLSRQIAREKARVETYTAKRREENASRIAQGLPPLPEEDVSRLFKMPAEPNRLESMLLLGQLDGYARSLESLAGAELVKMYAAKSGA